MSPRITGKGQWRINNSNKDRSDLKEKYNTRLNWKGRRRDNEKTKRMGKACSSGAGVQRDSPRGLYIEAKLSKVSFGIK